MRTDFGGRRWIRTTEVSDNRFTVCPLWPLGNSPICKAYCLNSRLLLELVDGLEPPTCWLQISCSTNWATPAFFAVSQEILFCFCISRWLLIYNTIRGSKCQHFFQTFLKNFKKVLQPHKSGLNPFVFFVYKNKKHRKGCFLFFGPPEVLFLILLLSASYITACSQL